MSQTLTCSLLSLNHAGEWDNSHTRNNCEHNSNQILAIGMELVWECQARVSPWSIWTAGMYPCAILACSLQQPHFNNLGFPCLLQFQVTHTPTAPPSLTSQVWGSSLQAIYQPSCCPRQLGSRLLAKWTENYGPTRLTRRKSPKWVVMAGEEISSMPPWLSSRLLSSASVDWSWSTRLKSYCREEQQLGYLRLYETSLHINSARSLVVSKSFSVLLLERVKHNWCSPSHQRNSPAL